MKDPSGRIRSTDGEFIDADRKAFRQERNSGQLASNVMGKSQILVLHPVDEHRPAFVELDVYLAFGDESLVAECASYRNDCGSSSDFEARLVVVDEAGVEHVLQWDIVAFGTGWHLMKQDLSAFKGQSVRVRFEAANGGNRNWCSEWAALARFYVVR